MDIKTNIHYFTFQLSAGTGIPPGEEVPVIYGIGKNSRLYRLTAAKPPFGKIMGLDISSYSGGAPLSALIAAILVECSAQGFSSAVICKPVIPEPVHIAFACSLASAMGKLGMRLYMRADISEKCGNTSVMIPTAISSGKLSDKLGAAVKKYRADNIAFEIHRLHTDYIPPASEESGTKLSYVDLQKLIAAQKPAINFSEELCVRYFHYRDNSGVHFVLFDDAFTIGKKLALGRAFGINTAFLYYPEVSNIIGEIEKNR